LIANVLPDFRGPGVLGRLGRLRVPIPAGGSSSPGGGLPEIGGSGDVAGCGMTVVIAGTVDSPSSDLGQEESSLEFPEAGGSERASLRGG
jgi:hypothetical protein